MRQRWEIVLPYPAGPPLSLNRRLHWAAEKRIHDQLQADVAWLLKAKKIPAMDRCAVWLDWTPRVTRRRDTDNVESTRKCCVDQLVKSGLVEDDTAEFVDRPENVINPASHLAPSLLLVIERR